MKRCPTCNRTFNDPSLSFCIEDGTPLVKAFLSEPDPEATIVVPSSSTTQIHADAAGATGEGRNAPGDGQAAAYQPPGQSAPPPNAKKRRVWLWAVGIAALLLVAAAGIGIAAVIVIPKMMQAAVNSANGNGNTERNLNGNRSTNENSNANTNSFVINENENKNTNANSNANADLEAQPPTDAVEVLSDLTDIEKEWTEANFSADKTALARILADDYVATLPDGAIQGKADYLRDIKPDKTVTEWEFKDLKLALKGDRATLKGRMRERHEGKDEDSVLQFTDKFVWRDERWQAVASEVSLVK